tara:strand:- start:76 stop:321 length:246 start_codon:yes stop_codon:yes gene_type:complete
VTEKIEALKQLDEHLLNIIKEAEMKFEPVMGNSYYLYERANGTHFISLIAPTEWIIEKQPNAYRSFIMGLESARAGEWKAL